MGLWAGGAGLTGSALVQAKPAAVLTCGLRRQNRRWRMANPRKPFEMMDVMQRTGYQLHRKQIVSHSIS